jgi:hypothetical protein
MKTRKKHPDELCSTSHQGAFFVYFYTICYLLFDSDFKNIPNNTNNTNIIILVVKVSPVIILSNTVSNIIIFSPIF